MKIKGLILAFTLVVTACGGDDVNDAAPRLIPSGGIGDGAIEGVLNVHVIDADTDEPIASAKVLIGEPGEEPLEGLTDSAGLVAFKDGSLSGPTTITVVAADYVVSTWFGANGANVTVPLNTEAADPDVPQAQISGTITGWDGLPDPATNHFFVGVVLPSQTSDLGAAENDIAQPSGVGGLPGNACIKSAIATQCDWTINSRTGKVAVYAIIVDVDTKGTAGDADDTSEVFGFAHRLGVTVEDNIDQSGLALTQVPIGGLVDVDITTETAPTGLNQVTTILGLEMDADGILMFGFFQDPAATGLTVPDLTGDLASGVYRAIAFAGNEGDEDDAPGTAILRRGITDLTGEIALGAWFPLARGLDVTAGEYSYTAVEGAVFHSALIKDASDNKVWDIALVDGRTTFTLPGMSPDPLPTGSFDLVVQAFDGDIDLSDFAIEDFADALDRVSTARSTFSR